MVETPTLLIGLGGTGGRIAYEVWKKVPEAGRSFVGLHIFDTDRNPDTGLGRAEFKPLWDEGMITQTSPAMSVGECFKTHQESTQVGRWFPNGDVISQKPMTDGAGQVRAVSRLAFLDTLARGDMRRLDATIERLLTVRAQRGIAAMRVLVVNTLAGGTGSGIFLQVALYIRQYLEQKRGQSNIVIRNVSMLPGPFAYTGTLGDRPQQLQNVLANGYAAIKELDGLTVARNSNLSESDKGFIFPLELEFVPASKEATEVGIGPAPYETVFLFDNINGNGQSLPLVENYIQQAIDAIHLQLLSPLEGKINGQADNNIRAIDKTQGRGRYASMGSATLRYPYGDILNYLSLRWAAQGLDDQWLCVDQEYRRNLEDALQKKKHNPATELPVLRTRYVEIVNHRAGGEHPHPFLREVRRSVQEIRRDPQGAENAEEKVTLWLNSVASLINTAITEEEGKLAADQGVNSGALRSERTFVEEVRTNLAEVERLHQRAKSLVDKTASMVVNDVLWEDAGKAPYVLLSPEARRSAGYRLNTWLLAPDGKDEGGVLGLHPVAVRYFLYKAYAEVLNRLADSETHATEMRESLESLRNRYDDPKTPVRETAEDAALNLGTELKWWNSKSKLDEFATRFEREIKQSINLTTSWASKAIEHEVLRKIKSVLEAMITDWEIFFRDLENSLKDGLQAEIQREERRHESGNPLDIPVLASAEDKRRFWKHVSVDFAHDGIGGEVSAQLYMAHYLKAVARRDDPDGLKRKGVDVGNESKELYEKQVIGWCQTKLATRSEIRLDIVSAIRKEWEIGSGSGKSADDWLQTRLQQVRSVAAPWLPPLNLASSEQMAFWGLSPETKNALSSPKLFQDLFSQGSDNPVVNSEFSDFEIKRFVAAFAISITDIPGFRSRNGNYWKAYQELRGQTLANPERGMTPHLDKRWDSPAYLREMDNGEQDAVLQRLLRATLYAVFHEEMQLWEKDGRWRWRYYENDRPMDLALSSGVPCEPTILGLYLGLASQYRLVPEIMTVAQMKERSAREQAGEHFGDLPLVRNGGKLLDTVVAQALRGGLEPRAKDMLMALTAAFADEILACALRFRGKDSPNMAVSLAEEALQSMVQGCARLNAEALPEQLANIRGVLLGQAKLWRNKLTRAEAKQEENGATPEPLVYLG